jgi:hypothetical protein
VTKWVAGTQCYHCTWRLDGYHKAEFWFVYSHCTQKLCYSSVHHIQLRKEKFQTFLKLKDFLNEVEGQISDNILSDIMEHLQSLQVTVKEYFSPVAEGYQWLQNLFMFSLTKQGLFMKQYEELIDNSMDEFERYIHKHSSD